MFFFLLVWRGGSRVSVRLVGLLVIFSYGPAASEEECGVHVLTMFGKVCVCRGVLLLLCFECFFSPVLHCVNVLLGCFWFILGC